MTQQEIPDPNAVLRISEADTRDTHVDDLLRRQASLRGDSGIGRDRGGKWYYRNWFVLMIAGLFAALAGWAMIEPLISDQPYIEGNIKTVEEGGPPGEPAITGAITVGSQQYVLMDQTRQRDPDGKLRPLDFSGLHVGDRVGIYVEIPESEEDNAAESANPVKIAAYVIPNAPISKVGDDLKAVLRSRSFGFMLLFPVAAGMVGLLIGAADGLLCRLPRRIFLAGGIGLVTGLFGGFISMMLAGIVYSPIHHWAMGQSGKGAFGLTTMGFIAQVGARSLGWAVAGISMGLGQGLALRSSKVIMYGFLGGLLGGLFGGILFDPIYILVRSEGIPSAYWSRMISLCVIGLSVGLMIGIVELLARDAWLRMVAGPLSGKEFLIFKNTMNVGASPKSDIYLFNDAGVAQTHAVIRATGDLYEIEGASDVYPVTINSRVVQRSRLRHGDQIGLGKTVFVFQRKRG